MEMIHEIGSQKKICPKCGREYSDAPALSRKDNKTEICPDCGIKEAIENFNASKDNGTIVLKEEDLLELICHIIDTFEALLDDKGIVLPNIERDQDDGLDPEEAANIFGDDYYRLEDEIKEIIKNFSNKED